MKALIVEDEKMARDNLARTISSIGVSESVENDV